MIGDFNISCEDLHGVLMKIPIVRFKSFIKETVFCENSKECKSC